MAQENIGTATSLVLMGGSAGSLDVLLHTLPEWQPDGKTAIVIVVHRKNDDSSLLTQLLQSKTPWPVKEAEDKESISPGTIYIGPADYHLLIEKDHSFSLDYSEKLNFSRPSIDISFETAANAYKEHLVCILLSGANMDGAKGLLTARENGSKIIIQRPDSAIIPFMPQNALEQLIPDAVLKKEDIMAALSGLLKHV